MGQSASKVVGKTAEKLSKKVAESSSTAATKARPPPPNPPPVVPKDVSSNTQANNPALFLRGTGVAQEDIRDKGQELYLQTRHKIDNEQKAKGPVDMPEDLLKFIQDVGPAKQSVDKAFTAPRLLEDENQDELKRVESVRKVSRERLKMPLMEGDDNFTTTRNTNFSRRVTQEERDFGISNVQMYTLLANRDKIKKEGLDEIYDTFLPKEEAGLWSEEEKAQHRKMLMDTLNCIEIPTLRTDSDGNFLGLYARDVPGEEVMAIKPIPETKVKLVLKHLAEMEEQNGDLAAAKLERRRELRKGHASS